MTEKTMINEKTAAETDTLAPADTDYWNFEKDPTLVLVDGFRAKVISPYLLQLHDDNVMNFIGGQQHLVMSNGQSLNVTTPAQLTSVNENSILRLTEQLPMKKGVLEAANIQMCSKLSENLVKSDNFLEAYMLTPGHDGKQKQDFAKMHFSHVSLTPEKLLCAQSADKRFYCFTRGGYSEFINFERRDLEKIQDASFSHTNEFLYSKPSIQSEVIGSFHENTWGEQEMGLIGKASIVCEIEDVESDFIFEHQSNTRIHFNTFPSILINDNTLLMHYTAQMTFINGEAKIEDLTQILDFPDGFIGEAHVKSYHVIGDLLLVELTEPIRGENGLELTQTATCDKLQKESMDLKIRAVGNFAYQEDAATFSYEKLDPSDYSCVTFERGERFCLMHNYKAELKEKTNFPELSVGSAFRHVYLEDELTTLAGVLLTPEFDTVYRPRPELFCLDPANYAGSATEVYMDGHYGVILSPRHLIFKNSFTGHVNAEIAVNTIDGPAHPRVRHVDFVGDQIVIRLENELPMGKDSYKAKVRRFPKCDNILNSEHKIPSKKTGNYVLKFEMQDSKCTSFSPTNSYCHIDAKHKLVSISDNSPTPTGLREISQRGVVIGQLDFTTNTAQFQCVQAHDKIYAIRSTPAGLTLFGFLTGVFGLSFVLISFLICKKLYQVSLRRRQKPATIKDLEHLGDATSPNLAANSYSTKVSGAVYPAPKAVKAL